MLQFLPLISGIASIAGMLGFGPNHEFTEPVATGLAATVGVASMIAASPRPRWLYNLRFISKVFDMTIDALAFNFGTAENKQHQGGYDGFSE